jgi:hypothetical protein
MPTLVMERDTASPTQLIAGMDTTLDVPTVGGVDGYNLQIYTPGEERDASCMSTRQTMERDTPCKSTLLVV